MRIRNCGLAAAAAALLAIWVPASLAQQCDDFFECTTNDSCDGEFCTGTFKAGPCNDFDPCTINDKCVDDPFFGPDCQGDPAEPGTTCGDGCGTCESLPLVGMVCITDGSHEGDPCDTGIGTPCFTGVCSSMGTVAFCAPRIVECPDTDGDPCTDSCNIETGECTPAPKCLSQCESCNTATGECEPANQGRACDDFDVCTTQSRCGTLDFDDGIVRGICEAGEVTPGSETPTPEVTATPTQPTGDTCPGDCDGNRVVIVSELITGVNIALTRLPIGRCPVFDRNNSQSVEVNELILAVNAALGTCPA